MGKDCSLEVLQAISQKVVEASPDAKIVIDGDGKIIIFNAQAELVFGYDRVDVLGRQVEMLLPDGAREKHATEHRAKYFEEPRQREMGFGMVLQGLHQNGKVFKVQIKLAPIIVSGAGIFALAVIRRVLDDH